MEVLAFRSLSIFFVFTLFYIIPDDANATTLILCNKCRHTVWPGIQPSAGKQILAGGGFKLPSNGTYSLALPALWSGRVWGRHYCSFDRAGRGVCATGDCGGSLFCAGLGGRPPATLAEITLTLTEDFYDVSLVDGYNLPLAIVPLKGRGACPLAGCVSDLNRMCPDGLKVRTQDGRRVVGCRSACLAFNSPQYCCTGVYGSPQACKPTVYSRVFKQACPRAYSFAYDDPTSLATCSGASYLVTFCPHH